MHEAMGLWILGLQVHGRVILEHVPYLLQHVAHVQQLKRQLGQRGELGLRGR